MTQEAMPASTIKVKLGTYRGCSLLPFAALTPPRTGKGELTVDQQFDKKERTTRHSAMHGVYFQCREILVNVAASDRWLKTLKGKFVYRGPKPADPDQFIKARRVQNQLECISFWWIVRSTLLCHWHQSRHQTPRS